MAVSGGNRKKGKRMPAYSADTLALRFILGLVLIAIGVCVFMSVDLNMSSNLLDGIRTTFFGIFGVASMILPVLFIWGGVLVILSTQRAVQVKPVIWASVAFLGVCTLLNLCSRFGSRDLFAYLSGTGEANYPTGNWGEILSRTYKLCSERRTAGGAFGGLLGWPLYQLLGTFLGACLTVLGTLAAGMMACTLTPSRIRMLIAKHNGSIPDTSEEDRRRLAWQQEQEAQRAYAMQQQAAYAARMQQEQLMQQYQQQAYARQTTETMPQTMPQEMTETARQRHYRPPEGWNPENNGAPANGVENWQNEVTTQLVQAGQTGRHRSAIFNRPAGTGANAQEAPKRKSRIFGDRKENRDGLSTVTAEEKQKNRRFEQTGEVQTTHEQHSQPSFTRPSYAQQLAEKAARQAELKEHRPEAPVREERWDRAPEKNPKPVTEERQTPRTEVPAMPVHAETGTPRREAERVPEPVVERPAERTEPVVRPAKPEQTEVPAVQQKIGQEAWQPELKLPPKELEEENRQETYWEPTPYNYPPITDLKLPVATNDNTEEEDLTRSRRLEETLASFRVQARVVNVTHGPAISRFELELAAGTKVNKVLELEKDIAYGMEATSVRIEAPIPGKSLVGVEVPNKKVTTVTMREVLESDRMQNAKSILTVALGKDLAGTPIVCDLAKMPHMLIAGQTGSGKSVCINAIINSLLYRAGPDEVKMILVDPKVVELQCYNGIPHLLIPVVNDPRKAAAALAWAVAEMMDRYDKFALRKVRNLDGYNDSLEPHEKPMPRIVVIIDELADLMMVCKKDVEEYICRLTQLARAAGIHLIVATQRPSVDVITGLIKANIPSRIAFKTASYVDSRTILDRNGSEQLLGWGDMLYLPTGSFAPTRVQGCFLSDEEVNKIVRHVREANPSTYDPNVLDKLEELTHEKEAPQSGMDMIGGAQDNADADGDLFQQCVEMAIQDGQISTSTLQRRLKIGYSRAGRLTDQLEERGIISAKDGSKPRKCLITREQWEEMKNFSEEG